MMKAWETTVRKTQAAAKRRAHSIFGTPSSVAHVDDDYVDDDDDGVERFDEIHESGGGPGEVYHADKILPNGDYYSGYWCDNFPHGKGKYLWTDGCVYEGDWCRGKTMGKGRFTWPSGATYEGEFKGGYMDGKGVYTGPSGDAYKGNWVMNLKHGNGVKEFSNGDCYDGEWCRGLEEGNGRYKWRNGNQYVGEWRNGIINGKGKFIWTNGNRFDGFWEDGLPKGNGTFRWEDGSFYVGNWSRDPKEQNGTYYPSGTSTLVGSFEWDAQEVFDDLRKYSICPNEKVQIMPSQKKLAVWLSSKGVNSGIRPQRMSVDARLEAGVGREFNRIGMLEGTKAASTCDVFDKNFMAGRDMENGLVGAQLENASIGTGTVSSIRIPKGIKRQGVTISKGHKNYELMLNLQLGIR